MIDAGERRWSGERASEKRKLDGLLRPGLIGVSPDGQRSVPLRMAAREPDCAREERNKTELAGGAAGPGSRGAPSAR